MASRLAALVCAEFLRSSEALPKEKARLRRDFPGRFDSFFKSLRRFAAGESSGDGVLRVSGWAVVLGVSGSVETGCDKGDGLIVRLSSDFPVLLVAELESGVPSRVYTKTLVRFVYIAAGGNSYRRSR
jgi:hypothetical protein